MLLGRNYIIFETFFPKNIPHLIHLFIFFILIDLRCGEKQNTANAEVETTLTQHYNIILIS